MVAIENNRLEGPIKRQGACNILVMSSFEHYKAWITDILLQKTLKYSKWHDKWISSWKKKKKIGKAIFLKIVEMILETWYILHQIFAELSPKSLRPAVVF